MEDTASKPAKVSDIAHLTMISIYLGKLSEGKDVASIAQAIDSACPFPRGNFYPYRVWLAIRKQFFAEHGLPRKGDFAKAKDRESDLVALMSQPIQIKNNLQTEV